MFSIGRSCFRGRPSSSAPAAVPVDEESLRRHVLPAGSHLRRRVFSAMPAGTNERSQKREGRVDAPETFGLPRGV